MSYFIRMFSRKDVTCDIYLENLSSVKWKFLRFCHLKKKKKSETMAQCAFWASSDAVGRKFIFHSEPKDSKGG